MSSIWSMRARGCGGERGGTHGEADGAKLGVDAGVEIDVAEVGGGEAADLADEFEEPGDDWRGVDQSAERRGEAGRAGRGGAYIRGCL